jgi:serine/threonine protein kinase
MRQNQVPKRDAKRVNSFRNPFVRGGSALSTRQLHHYQMGKRIGKGAYGKVFRAKKKTENHRVALKIVDTSSSEHGYTQFNMERWTTEMLSQDGGIGPNFHDGWCIRKNGKTLGMLAIELWDCSLEVFMKLTARRTVPKIVIDKVQTQLAQMHSHYKVAHMDVHAGNVLLKLEKGAPRDKPKVLGVTLADFGNVMYLEGIDEELMQLTIDMYDLPRSIKDPRRIDHAMLSLMKSQWK